MIGLLNKLPTLAKELICVLLSVVVGVFIFKQEKFEFIFELMDGFLSYLSIMSSVSFAILAVLIQQFDRKSSEEKKYKQIKNEAISISRKMNVELWRIVFMLLPVFGYFVMSFFNEQNRLCASLLASITFLAIVFSITLPFKYVNFIKMQMVSVVEEAEEKKKEERAKSAEEMMEKIKNM